MLKKSLLAASILASISTQSHATLELCIGPAGCTIQGPDIENVLMPDEGTTGFTITGHTNQTNTLIDFTSTEEMITTGGGQAALEAVDGELGDVMIDGNDPTIGFSHFVFNVHATETGTINISAVDNFGALFDFGPTAASENGQNFFTIGSLDDQYIKSVSISGIGITAIDELQQVRVDPATLPCPDCEPNPNVVVPAPGAALLFGTGLIGLAGVARRRQGAAV